MLFNVLTGVLCGTGVVARVRVEDPGYHQVAGLHLLLGDHSDAAPRRIADQLRVLVPDHVRVRPGRLGGDAGQIDVTAALDEQLAVGQDLGFGGCQRAPSNCD